MRLRSSGPAGADQLVRQRTWGKRVKVNGSFGCVIDHRGDHREPGAEHRSDLGEPGPDVVGAGYA
jgi:hypothetical protein